MLDLRYFTHMKYTRPVCFIYGLLLLIGIFAPSVLCQQVRRFSSKVVVPILGEPDISVIPGSLRIEPQLPVARRTVFFMVEVKNTGKCPLPLVKLECKTALQGQPRTTVTNLASWENPRVNDLQIGATAEVVIRWDAPLKAGVYDLEIIADPEKRIAETNEDNNSLIAEYTVIAGPELSITCMRLEPAGPYAIDRPPQLLVDVINTGQTTSREVFLQVNDDMGVTHSLVPPLPAGAATTVSASVSVFPRLHVEAYLDRFNTVPEDDEDNNRVNKQFELDVYRRVSAASPVNQWDGAREWLLGAWTGCATVEYDPDRPGQPRLDIAAILRYPVKQWKMEPSGAVNRASSTRDPATWSDESWSLGYYLEAAPNERPEKLHISVEDASMQGRYRAFIEVLVQRHRGRYGVGGFRFGGPGAGETVAYIPGDRPQKEEIRMIPLGIYYLDGKFSGTLDKIAGEWCYMQRLVLVPLVEYESETQFLPDKGARLQLDGELAGAAYWFRTGIADEEDVEWNAWTTAVAGMDHGSGERFNRARMRVRFPMGWEIEKRLPSPRWTWKFD
jgi:CARDB